MDLGFRVQGLRFANGFRVYRVQDLQMGLVFIGFGVCKV